MKDKTSRRKFFFSFTDTIKGFMKGEISLIEVEDTNSYFVFNCGEQHAFPWAKDMEGFELIAIEASWVSEREEFQRLPVILSEDNHLMKISDLEPHYQERARQWNRILFRAWEQGRVSFTARPKY
jgi:hypothetical protein